MNRKTIAAAALLFGLGQAVVPLAMAENSGAPNNSPAAIDAKPSAEAPAPVKKKKRKSKKKSSSTAQTSNNGAMK